MRRHSICFPMWALAAIFSSALAFAACAPAAAPTPTPVPAKPAPAATSPAPAAQPTAAPKPGPAGTPPAPTAPPAKPAATAAPAKPSSQIGTATSPIRMAFVPSGDVQKILASGKPIGDLLEKETGLKFEASVPNSYAAVIEAMGARNVEVAWLAPFAYVLAHDKFGVAVILGTIRQGSPTYRGQIVVHADSGLNDVKELKGKKFAFVDPGSASGYLFPNALLRENGVDSKTFFGETTFAGGHDKVIIAVYNKQVDGGATYGDSIEGGPPTDARTIVTQTLPDVMQKVKVISRTPPIPNDTVSLRKDLPADVVEKIKKGLLTISKSEEGKKHLRDLYRIDGLAETNDKAYDPIRRAAQVLNLNLEEQIQPAQPQPRPTTPAKP